MAFRIWYRISSVGMAKGLTHCPWFEIIISLQLPLSVCPFGCAINGPDTWYSLSHERVLAWHRTWRSIVELNCTVGDYPVQGSGRSERRDHVGASDIMTACCHYVV